MLFSKIAFVICLIFWGGSTLLYGQFNDSTFYHLQLKANGSINQAQGSSAYLLNNAINFNIDQKKLSLNSSNSWVYGKQNTGLTNNDFSSTLTFNYYPYSKKFYYWGLANYNTSYSLKINNQLLAGAGLAWSLIDSDDFFVNLSDGLLWDQSNLAANLGNNLLRNSLRLRLRYRISNLLLLEHTSFVQHAFKNRRDYILRTNTGLSIPLKKWFSLNTSLTYNKLSFTESENLIFTYGLILENFW